MAWNTLGETPPDELLEVVDKNGNTAIAQPTYYPFIVKPKTGQWQSNVELCEPYWDGGWLIQTTLENTNPIGDIIEWRKFNHIKQVK